ncbi:hypothetical protein ACSFA0_23720 [Variovorax sp. LT1P1]|uniref:hypothetical protein n=1 Tax=Variovorax sp. LT1P1 TaxID=3443730 RepID=UPI003F4467E7
MAANNLASRGVKWAFAVALAASWTISSASIWSDPAYIQRQADLTTARRAGVDAEAAAGAVRDAAALASASCTDLDAARKTSALAFMDRGQPPDPSRVIQNSTCFLDVAAFQVPVSLTGIGFLDGLLNNIMTKMVAGACGKLNSYISDLKNSALSQISGAIRNATGGALSIGSLDNPSISVEVGGQTIRIDDNTDVASALQAAGTNAAVRAANEAAGNLEQSTYDAIKGTLDPNAGAAVEQARAEVKQVQCNVRGVGANETCPCPTPESLAGGTQTLYPQCSDTYKPWDFTSSGGA